MSSYGQLLALVGEAVRMEIAGEHYVGRLVLVAGGRFALLPVAGLNHIGGYVVSNGNAASFNAEAVGDASQLELSARAPRKRDF